MMVSKKGKIILVITLILFLCKAHAIRQGREVTDPGKYAFIVSLRDIRTHFCGGSILNKRYILTAAHCLIIGYGRDKELAKSRMSIHAGTLSRLPSRQASVYYMEDYHYFEEDYFNHYFNDILLIRTTAEINIDGVRIKDIKLPQEDYIHTGNDVRVTAAGWGIHTLRGTSPRRLQEISLSVGSHEQCLDLNLFYIIDQHFCTVDHPRSGPCPGDSGGPIIGSRGDLVGVISYREEYINDLTRYQTHVNVHSFKQWILFWSAI